MSLPLFPCQNQSKRAKLMSENPLGKSTEYISEYAPSLLFPIARSEKRDELDANYLDFDGEDIWNAYELSWLNLKGLPQVAIAEFRVPASSSHIIESKSLKLYLNSFNQTRLANAEKVKETIQSDLSKAANAPVKVTLFSVEDTNHYQVLTTSAECIDDQAIEIDAYSYHPSSLAVLKESHVVEESLCSHVLKSNCLITSQPDWATVIINYQGKQICREALLRYLVSFRSHNEFHEQCVERIYSDIKKYCQPDKLSVYARYTRRGGLDINPWRSDFENEMGNIRLSRQ